MKKFISFFVLFSMFSIFADTYLGQEFYNTPIRNGDIFYSYWGHIQKDKDDVLDHLIVQSYEKPYHTTCEWLRNLSFNDNVRFLYDDFGGAVFILLETCKNERTVWIKGFVSLQGKISVLEHTLE